MIGITASAKRLPFQRWLLNRPNSILVKTMNLPGCVVDDSGAIMVSCQDWKNAGIAVFPGWNYASIDNRI